MTNDTASILAKHQRRELGMSSGSPDTCACGAKVMPDPEALGPDGTARNITDRRDEAFAAHQAEMLKPRELDAERSKDSWNGETFALGDIVRHWDGRRRGVVTRIFKKSPKSRWYATIESRGMAFTYLANDLQKVVGR